MNSGQIIEDFISVELREDVPTGGRFFEKEVGSKLFAISSYLGQVIIKNTRATKWIMDDKDPRGEINIKLVCANKCEIYPAHRVLNRIRNDSSENLFH